MADPAEKETETKTEEPKKRGPGRPKKQAPTASDELNTIVQGLLQAVVDKKVKVNHDEQAAAVDLGNRVRAGQGMEFRQLFVKADAGFIAVRLIEGFKPAHGGSEQRKTLYAISVPVGETEAYNALQRRFFGYSLQTNVEQGKVLLDTVLETVAKS